MNEQTKDQLFRLAAIGKQHGLSEAVRWLMAQMLVEKKAGKRRQRKRTVALVNDSGKVRGGQFKINESVLKQAEAVDEAS